MAVYETFSQRRKKLVGGVPDVYTYDALPQPLRVQLYQAMLDGFGEWYTKRGNNDVRAQNIYAAMVHLLRREYGVFKLAEGTHSTTSLTELRAHFLTADAEQVVDAVELACRVMDKEWQSSTDPDYRERLQQARDEINIRFRQHGVGYEFTSGEIVRIDSELVHQESVRPALVLLSDDAFTGPQEEFLRAFEHYRKGDTKEAIADALKSFESTMKVIAHVRGWAVDPNATAKALIQLMYDNGLVPTYWQSHLTGLRQVLESAIPTPRNRQAGHGQGVTPQVVPDYLAGYVLQMTAATIVFLVKAEKAL